MLKGGSINTLAFFEIIRAGLWEKEVRLLPYGDVDYDEIMRLAQEQAVVGLAAAGLEHVTDVKVPQEWALQFAGQTLQLEQRNKAMNQFIAGLVAKMRQSDIYTLLVKGQGIAQCYEKPLWRTAGDVDLYLSKDNYEKAKAFLIPLAQHIEAEDKNKLHQGMAIDGWIVELHGTMYTYISRRINTVNNEVNQDIFFNGNVRSWNDNGVQVFLPSDNNDAIIVFNHFINHFYGEGVGLRQICDWCRLLWIYKDSLNYRVLESRIIKAGLYSEWKAFAAFAVDYLGMPVEAMPFYEDKPRMHKKAEKICKLVIETGNFGHNKNENYRKTSSKMKGNLITFKKRLGEFLHIATIFPVNAPKFFITYVFGRIKAIACNG